MRRPCWREWDGEGAAGLLSVWRGDTGAGVGGRTTDYSSGSYPSGAGDVESQKFTGKERDAETGLDYFGARYLSSAQGRFTSPDPGGEGSRVEDPQSWNAYAHVRNNPLRLLDPDGRDYHVCDNAGKNCADLTNEQYDQYRSTLDGRVSPGGTIYATNSNGSETAIGSASYYNGDAYRQAERAGAFVEAFAVETVKTAVFTLATAGTFRAFQALQLAGRLGSEVGAVGTGVGLLNKINHIFGKAAHNLGVLVQHFGTEAKAYAALEEATTQHVVAKGITGTFEEVVSVGGTNVTVRGAVVNGAVKIGTAFR